MSSGKGFPKAGQEVQCGWLTDKFGVSWQIIPRALGEWMSGGPAKGSKRDAGAAEDEKTGYRQAEAGVRSRVTHRLTLGLATYSAPANHSAYL